jgi:hypothetical protein
LLQTLSKVAKSALKIGIEDKNKYYKLKTLSRFLRINVIMNKILFTRSYLTIFINRNLVGSIYMYGRFCIKIPQSRMKGERHRLSPLSL